MEHVTIKQLAAAWLAAKQDEDAARAARLEIEEAIVAQMPGKDEGATSIENDAVRVVVTRKLNRKVDADALKDAWESLPATLHKAFNWKPDLSVSVFRKLDADEAAQCLKFITTTPAKPSIKVEEIQAND